MAISPDGKTVLTTSDDKTVKLWSVETHQELMTIATEKEGTSSGVFASDGSFIAYASGKKIHIIRAPSFAQIAEREKTL